MAINKVPQSTKLVIKVQTGLNAAGNPVYRLRNFTNVKTDAVDADVYEIGSQLAALQINPPVGISRVDEGDLISE